MSLLPNIICVLIGYSIFSIAYLGVLSLSVAWFAPISPRLYTTRLSTSATIKFEYPDVSVAFEPGGWQHVRVDQREEWVTNEDAEFHPIAKEARRRILERGGQPGIRERRLDWSRLIRRWLLPVGMLGFVLFRWWPKPADYAAGPRL